MGLTAISRVKLKTMKNETNAAAGGTFSIGGDLRINRLGYGAMRITGEGFWGYPKDRKEALAVLKRTADLGMGSSRFSCNSIR